MSFINTEKQKTNEITNYEILGSYLMPVYITKNKKDLLLIVLYKNNGGIAIDTHIKRYERIIEKNWFKKDMAEMSNTFKMELQKKTIKNNGKLIKGIVLSRKSVENVLDGKIKRGIDFFGFKNKEITGEIYTEYLFVAKKNSTSEIDFVNWYEETKKYFNDNVALNYLRLREIYNTPENIWEDIFEFYYKTLKIKENLQLSLLNVIDKKNTNKTLYNSLINEKEKKIFITSENGKGSPAIYCSNFDYDKANIGYINNYLYFHSNSCKNFALEGCKNINKMIIKQEKKDKINEFFLTNCEINCYDDVFDLDVETFLIKKINKITFPIIVNVKKNILNKKNSEIMFYNNEIKNEQNEFIINIQEIHCKRLYFDNIKIDKIQKTGANYINMCNCEILTPMIINYENNAKCENLDIILKNIHLKEDIIINNPYGRVYLDGIDGNNHSITINGKNCWVNIGNSTSMKYMNDVLIYTDTTEEQINLDFYGTAEDITKWEMKKNNVKIERVK